MWLGKIENLNQGVVVLGAKEHTVGALWRQVGKAALDVRCNSRGPGDERKGESVFFEKSR